VGQAMSNEKSPKVNALLDHHIKPSNIKPIPKVSNSHIICVYEPFYCNQSNSVLMNMFKKYVFFGVYRNKSFPHLISVATARAENELLIVTFLTYLEG
jgi:hypothetical protein